MGTACGAGSGADGAPMGDGTDATPGIAPAPVNDRETGSSIVPNGRDAGVICGEEGALGRPGICAVLRGSVGEDGLGARVAGGGGGVMRAVDVGRDDCGVADCGPVPRAVAGGGCDDMGIESRRMACVSMSSSTESSWLDGARDDCGAASLNEGADFRGTLKPAGGGGMLRRRAASVSAAA